MAAAELEFADFKRQWPHVAAGWGSRRGATIPALFKVGETHYPYLEGGVDWRQLIDRHAAGDFGELGRYNAEALTEEEEFRLGELPPSVVNRASIAAKSGPVRSRYRVPMAAGERVATHALVDVVTVISPRNGPRTLITCVDAEAVGTPIDDELNTVVSVSRAELNRLNAASAARRRLAGAISILTFYTQSQENDAMTTFLTDAFSGSSGTNLTAGYSPSSGGSYSQLVYAGGAVELDGSGGVMVVPGAAGTQDVVAYSPRFSGQVVVEFVFDCLSVLAGNTIGVGVCTTQGSGYFVRALPTGFDLVRFTAGAQPGRRRSSPCRSCQGL